MKYQTLPPSILDLHQALLQPLWTNVHNHDDPEPEVNHTEQYPDFFDSEQFNTQALLVEPENNKIYAGENLSTYQDTQVFSATKYADAGVKAAELTSSFQIDHDRHSSASQYSRPIENIESTGVEFRIGIEGPEYNIPGEPYIAQSKFQFGEIGKSRPTNAAGTQDSRSRPVSDNSSGVGPTPFHSTHSGGVTMPPVNMMFPNPMQDPRGGLLMLGSLVLPPEQEHLETNGTAIYQFGVDFSEERKIESTEHHNPPNHLVRGDPTQQVLQRSGRMDYAERLPYQRAEVGHEMNRTVNVNRTNHDLNLPSHQVDNRFNTRLETSNQNQHANFEDIGPSIMGPGPGREPHGRTSLMHQRLEPHFEERKSNHIVIDDSRNQNRNNIQPPVHMAPTRPFGRPENIRKDFEGVPAEVIPESPFFSEAKRMEPPNHVFEDPVPEPSNIYQHSHQPNHHAHYVSNQPQTFKPNASENFLMHKANTGFKAAGYVQSYGVEQLQNLEGENGPTPTPPPLDSQYNNHGPTMVNTNTEYKQQQHHVPAYANQITYYPHVPAYTAAPVQTYHQPHTYTAPRTAVGYPYSTQVVSTNAVYPGPPYSTQPVGVYPVR